MALTSEAKVVLQNNTNKNWIKDRGLRKLNLGIGFMLSASATSGYCASMINGLLVLPECTMQPMYQNT
jgi:hypothetical protein